MPRSFDESQLFRRWIHVHEEDTEDTNVFRPADYPLPPSRGRKGYEFRADGAFVRLGIGPTDRPQAATGTWSFAGDAEIVMEAEHGQQQVLRIASVTPERLVVQKKQR